MPQARGRAGQRLPYVGIILDISKVYGRSILRGIMKVASTERRWVTYKDFWRSSELLVASQITLNEITERCGFSDVQNLARSLLKETGVTPAAYRREMMRGAKAADSKR